MWRWAIIIAVKRLWNSPGQALLAVSSVIVALGLATSLPIFSQAVDMVMLRGELNKLSTTTERPAFSTRIYVFPSRRKPLSLEDCEQLGVHIAQTLSSEVRLPLEQMVMQLESAGMVLQPQAGDPRYGEEQAYLASVSVAFLADVDRRMELVAGEPLDTLSPSVLQGVLEVWMHASLAGEMGVHPGETFDLLGILGGIRLPVQVAGIWQARDTDDPFWWFQDPDLALGDKLLVSRQDYITHVEPYLPSKTGFATWYVVLDDSRILPAQAGTHARGLKQAIAVINKYLPGAQMDISPLEPLENFQHRATTMMTLLLGFSVPAMGFLLYFMALISVIIVRWQRRETSIMASRGLGRGRIFSIALVEGLMVMAVGSPLGIGAGLLLARLMGNTLSFLSFAPRPPLPVSLRGLNVWLTVAAMGASLVARLWPTLRSAGRSVVTYEQAHSRPVRTPFWQRYFLDLLLIAPTAYAYRQMGQWGALGMLVRESTTELYRDPLLILVPTLFALTASLLSVRVFPLMMRLTDWLGTVSPWISVHLTFRQLSRQSQQYVNPQLLVIAALSLGTYLASMAASLDQWQVDRMYYRVGTDVAFRPHMLPEVAASSSGEVWMLPVSDYLAIPGVQEVTRMGDYPVYIPGPGGEDARGRFLGIDRLEFPDVAWFRSDFTAVSLGELMNRLALQPDGILVPRSLLGITHTNVGDQLRLRVVMEEVELVTPFTIVGVYDYFPTVYEDRPAVVGNLDYLFVHGGRTFPYRVWLRTESGVDGTAVFKAVESGVVEATRRGDARALIKAERDTMERVGISGTLSMGFLASAVMAGTGLLVYNYASLQERFYRFAVLRAMGLAAHQLTGQVVLEYGVLTLYGAGSGVLIGLLTSRLFIPFFRVTGESGLPLPPLLPLIAWSGITRLAVGFVVAMIVTQVVVVAVGVRRGLFQVLRMGE
jgi:putative ABC transport system permease protein